MKAIQRRRINQDYVKVASTRDSRVLLFGNPNDPEVLESKRRAEISGRKVEFQNDAIIYPGDEGSAMGMSY